MFWNQVESLLPKLRRAGRALTGSKTGADQCVLVALELLRAEPWRASKGPEVAAFAALIDGWSVLRNKITPQFASDDMVLALQRLGDEDRAILVLHGVMRLGLDRCAQILDQPSAHCRQTFFDALVSLQLVSGKRALLLDSSPDSTGTIDRLLRGSELAAASIWIRSENVERAVERELPSLIVAEPSESVQRNTFDTLRRVRRWWRAPSILIVGDREDLPNKADRSGLTIFGKPYVPDDLLGAIRTSLRCAP